MFLSFQDAVLLFIAINTLCVSWMLYKSFEHTNIVNRKLDDVKNKIPELEKSAQYLFKDIKSEISKTNEAHKTFQYSIDECFKNIKVDILTLQADILKNVNPVKATEASKTKVPANRNPRTEEQKRMASLKKKEWWDKKRQEQKIITPDDVSITLPVRPTQNV